MRVKGQVTNLKEDNGNLQVNVTLNENSWSLIAPKTPFVHWIYTLITDGYTLTGYLPIFKNDTQSWHFYEQGSINPRYFYNFKEQKWEAGDLPQRKRKLIARYLV